MSTHFFCRIHHPGINGKEFPGKEKIRVVPLLPRRDNDIKDLEEYKKALNPKVKFKTPAKDPGQVS